MKILTKRLFNQKLKAGALQYVVAMSLLIFFLMGMFIMLAHYSNMKVNESWVQEVLHDNISSAEVLLRNDIDLLENPGKKVLRLFPDSLSAVRMTAKAWGAYHLVQLETSFRHHRKKSCLLLSDDVSLNKRPSLYLADKRRYLSVCGDTWLGGPVFLPKLGVRKSYVDGVGYYRESAVQGEIRYSASELPAIRPPLLQQLEDQWKIDFKQDSLVQWEDVSSNMIKNAFSRPARVIISTEDSLVLDHIAIYDHVKLIANRAIMVKASSNLSNCILVAPQVYFEKGFKGNCQVLARDRVQIEENVQLNYPSLVFMQGNNPQKELIVGEHVLFAGDMVVLGKQGKKLPNIKLSKESKIQGFVYCDGSIELEGNVAGSVYANSFFLRTRSAIYENHLLNNRVDIQDLNKSYLGASWLLKPKRREVLAWY